MLVEKASDLNKLVNQAKKEAQQLLKEAVGTGDIRQALNVFMLVSKLLPSHDWLIDESTYPLVRADSDRNNYGRGAEIKFSEAYDEEFYIVRNDPNPAFGDRGPWDPAELERATALAWEIVKNGYAGYCFDW